MGNITHNKIPYTMLLQQEVLADGLPNICVINANVIAIANSAVEVGKNVGDCSLL